MRVRRMIVVGVVAMLVLTAIGITTSLAAPVPLAEQPAIRLKAATFTPGLGELPEIPANLAQSRISAERPGSYIVQFSGPVTEADRDGLAALGVEIKEYIPDYAFKVRMNGAQRAQVELLANTAWIGNFHPAYKISPEIVRDGMQLYRIRIDGTSPTLAAQLEAAGGIIIRQSGAFLLVAAEGASINGLAFIEEVAWIENFLFHEKHNEYGAGIIIGSANANANGYDGSTQIAAVADTGFDEGLLSPTHPGVGSRLIDIQSFSAADSGSCYDVIPDGAQDPDSGHGTHVAISVVGAGDGNGYGRGTAPAADLVFQAVEEYVNFVGFCSFQYPDGYYLLGIPDDLTDLFQPAYDEGARVHANSWGSSVAGDYTADAATVDTFMWNNPDFLVTTSAGNAGIDANSNGVVDDDSIGSPATAKNLLTVGASENERSDNFPCDTGLTYTDSSGNSCNSLGGINDIFDYGEAWPDDFPANPLFGDESAGNAEQMAAFSSRGPTDDGRIKPDIVAPGTWILSGFSDLYQQGYDGVTNPRNGAFQYDGYGFPLTDQYKYLSGTSMSNPIAAGGAVVVRDFYEKTDSHNASAALVKATLINSAVDLLDENNDGVDDNDFPIPNVHEGWGRIDINAATDGSHVYVDNAAGVSTGGSSSSQYTVNAGTPFRVTLVWTDFPSTEAAATNLVNNLNLVVTAPDNTVYRGNVFSGGWSVSGGSADTVNNVENVYIQSPASGTWTVEVDGANVPQGGSQPFALVVDGDFGTAGPTATPVPPTATNTPTNTPVPPTATNTPTNTPVPPTATNTPVGPTATNTPTATATNTAVPPTATNTPTNTPVPPTETPVPPTATPGSGGGAIYISSSTGGNAGISYNDEDIIVQDLQTGVWSMYFDGSDVGVTTDINAFHIQDDGSILMSFNTTTTAGAAGSVDDSDIVRFIPTSTGSTTAGTFELYFDGSDVGLTTNGEDIDALSIDTNGDLIISGIGGVRVSGLGAADEDMLRFSPTSLGATTSGSWSVEFDGSDVALNNSGDEDVWGATLLGGDLYLSFRGAFTVTGASGDGADIANCGSVTLGTNTSCSFSLYLDGSANNLAGERVDGIHVAP